MAAMPQTVDKVYSRIIFASYPLHSCTGKSPVSTKAGCCKTKVGSHIWNKQKTSVIPSKQSGLRSLKIQQVLTGTNGKQAMRYAPLWRTGCSYRITPLQRNPKNPALDNRRLWYPFSTAHVAETYRYHFFRILQSLTFLYQRCASRRSQAM